jgi:hypothetical protein
MMKKSFFIGVVLCSLVLSVTSVSGAWTPKANEIAPTKDAYVSIGGALGDPLANFGLAGSLDVGTGFNGICVSAIQFDFSAVPSNSIDLTFKSDMIVYGESTRELKVNILLGQDWDELSVTGLDNPFNATEFWAGDYANVTILTIGGSTDEISINLTDFLSYRGLVTLILATGVLDESWITLSSQENEYLMSYSEPPRLVFTVPPEEESSINSFSTELIIGSIFLAVITILIKNKKSKARNRL